MTAKALAAPLLLALALSACSSAPQHPAPQLPDTWFSAAGAHPADAESLASWWRQFDDPQLTALVHRAMQQNHDVRLAMARVDSARAQLRQSRAGLLPSFDLPGSASRQWIENDQDAEPGSPLAEFIPDDDPIAFDSWELALQATWELDLFGATRARRDSAAQQLRSAEAQTVAARLAVAANTAQGYLQLRALQGQRALLVEGIEVARELERIAGLLFHAGEVTRLDVEATSAERASLEADLDELDIHLAEAQLALDTLLAEPPGSSAVQLAASAAVPLAEQPIAAGQPIDLLRRRPDLIAEAARLDAAELQSLAGMSSTSTTPIAPPTCSRSATWKWPSPAAASRCTLPTVTWHRSIPACPAGWTWTTTAWSVAKAAAVAMTRGATACTRASTACWCCRAIRSTKPRCAASSC